MKKTDSKREYPFCCNPKYHDCFARDKSGYCECLTTADFKNNICPFYKSKEQHQLELIEIKIKNESLGIK